MGLVLLLNNKCISMFLRATFLFTLGGLFTLVINIMQMEYKTNLFQNNIMIFLKTYWWAVPFCGCAAGKLNKNTNHLFHHAFIPNLAMMKVHRSIN